MGFTAVPGAPRKTVVLQTAHAALGGAQCLGFRVKGYRESTTGTSYLPNTPGSETISWQMPLTRTDAKSSSTWALASEGRS